MGRHSRLPTGGLLCSLGSLGIILYSGDGGIEKTAKYAGLTSDYHFQPIAVESLGPDNEPAVHFLMALGNKIARQTGDERESAFLFQRLSVLVQCFNCMLLHNFLWMTTARIKCHSLDFRFPILF